MAQDQFPSKLCIVTWLWADPHAKQKFKPYHVARWARMVRANLDMDARLVCITDQEKGVINACEEAEVGCETYPIWDAPVIKSRQWHKGRPQCYRRARLFDPDLARTFGEFIVSMDLDLVVLGKLDPLFEKFPEFRIMRGGGNRNPYNGSMWMFRWNSRPQIWERFTPDMAAKASQKFMGSDQAWFRWVLGENEKVWSGNDGAYQFASLHHKAGNRTKPPSDARVVFFAGGKKPWHVPIQRAYPWIREAYGDTPEFESKSREDILDRSRGRDRRGRPTKNVRTLESMVDEPAFSPIVIPEPIQHKSRGRNPADGGILWCYADPGGWGFALYIAALRRGWDARLWGSASSVDAPGYVFFRVGQHQDELERDKNMARALLEWGNTLIPEIEMIDDYEDKGLQHVKYKDWMPSARLFYEPSLAVNHAKECEYPIVSKSRTGSGSQAVRILKNQQEAVTEIHTVFGQGIETHMGELQKDYLMWEEFLPGNSYVYRVTRIGSRHFMLRVHNRPDIPTASGSGKVDVVDYNQREELEVLDFAKRFFDDIGTKWCAIDVIYDPKRHKWRVLETSLAWVMSKAGSNPSAKFEEDGRTVSNLFEVVCEEIANYQFGP